MKRLIILGVALVIGVIGFFAWWNISLSPVNSEDKKSREFTINPGDGIREIATKLHDQKLIRDQIAFFLLVKQLGLERKIQAGSFTLSPSMTLSDLANTLTIGREDMRITIPEGLRSEQILEYLHKEKVGGDKWTVATQIPIWKKEEGKYFPETYFIPKGWSIDEIRKYLTEIFEKKFDASLVADAKAVKLTPQQVLILASIVEKEARTDKDRPIVAGILLNRLRDNHPLQVDATAHYILGNSKNNWWPKEVFSEDLKIPSPFNTYLNAGLPPAPIANPGLSSIKAVIYPSKTSYYFYISDKQGDMHYAKTLEDHNANIAKYLTNN